MQIKCVNCKDGVYIETEKLVCDKCFHSPGTMVEYVKNHLNTHESCDNCRNVTRYGNEWKCVVCGHKFVPYRILPVLEADNCVRVPSHAIIHQSDIKKITGLK